MLDYHFIVERKNVSPRIYPIFHLSFHEIQRVNFLFSSTPLYDSSDHEDANAQLEFSDHGYHDLFDPSFDHNSDSLIFDLSKPPVDEPQNWVIIWPLIGLNSPPSLAKPTILTTYCILLITFCL